MRFDNMILYFKQTCPFCLKVLDYMKANDIQMDMRDTLNAENREELMRINGTTQVPCLVVDGNPMLESNDIIAYLDSITYR